jgi:hypothetical protein
MRLGRVSGTRPGLVAISGVLGAMTAALVIRVKVPPGGHGGPGFWRHSVHLRGAGLGDNRRHSLFGGVGTIAGSALGALLFSVINNVLALTNTDPQWQAPQRSSRPGAGTKSASVSPSPCDCAQQSKPDDVGRNHCRS